MLSFVRFWRILRTSCFAMLLSVFSFDAFADNLTIGHWTGTTSEGTVVGVSRCGPKSGNSLGALKDNWGTSNWGLQNAACYCRARDIAEVSDWDDIPNNYNDATSLGATSHWYGSGTNFGSADLCLQGCAEKCQEIFDNDTSSYQSTLCGGDCQIDQGGTPVTTYTITYDLQGGTGCNASDTYNIDQSATICEPTREGYTFDGWMDNNTSETYSGGDVVYNVDLDLVAFWTEIPGTRYTILYDTNGGSGCADTEYVISTTLCTPSREAYHFDGWVDADTQNIYNGGTTVSDIDLILTAQWTFVGCANGQYFENNTCNTCVSGYTSDGATATSQNDCYRSCTTDDVDYSRGTVNGKYYYGGNNQCEPTDCVNGWHVKQGLNLASTIGNTNTGLFAATNSSGELTGVSDIDLSVYGLTGSSAFAVDYADKGIVYGHGRCSTIAQEDNVFPIVNAKFVDTLADESGTGTYCYCSLDGHKPSNNDLQSFSTPWMFYGKYSQPSTCSDFCAFYCGYGMTTVGDPESDAEFLSFRAALLSSVGASPAMCEIDTYTIVYNSNGGTEYADGSYTIESDTITLPVPVRDEYEFDGWYDNADFYGSPITEITYGSYGDKEYYAKWIKLPCNNNYYGDGFICDTCPVAYPNSDNTDNNDITRCYAIVDYTNYCAPGASCYSVPSSKRYYYSSENPDAYIVKNLFTPSNTDDYTFGGWYLNDEYNGDEIINGSTLSGNLILYGKWDEILTTEWGCRVGKVTADADSWSEDIKEVGTDIPSAESLRSATGIVTRAGNDGSYILNYQDQQDYQTNLDRYLTGEEFYVTWGNTTIRGWAGCSANTWNTDKPNYSSQTLTYTNAGCGCSIDKERWIVKRNLLTQNGLTWDEKNEYCRANCPAACANAVANDYAFRTALFNGQCPAEYVEQITCDPGYYLPGGANECKKCNINGTYCRGGTFTPSDSDQGLSKCPDVVNYPGAYWTRKESILPYISDSLDDNIEACAALFWFEDYAITRGSAGTDHDNAYNANSPINQNVVLHTTYCFYNEETQLYDRCFTLPGVNYPTACRNGYTINPELLTNVPDLGDNWSDVDHEIMLSVWNEQLNNLGNLVPPCVLAEPGYYTAFYDLHKDDTDTETQRLASDIGVISVFGNMVDVYYGGTQQSNEIYKQCPSEYPESAAGSWQKAHCYSQITYVFNDDTEDVIDKHYYSDSATNGYQTTLPTLTRDGYEFDGWYNTPEFDGQPVTNETVFAGNTTLYAKWDTNQETKCINQGQYYSWDSVNNTCVYNEEAACTDSDKVWDTNTCITHDEYCENHYGTGYMWNGESCEQVAFECTSGKWLHLGDNAKLCLSETKPASHESPVVLKVQVGNNVYYLSATPGADYLPVNEDSTGVKMKMYYKGRTYNVHDESISVF